MIENKFDLRDEVFYFNDAVQDVESSAVACIAAVAMSAESDAKKILYSLENGITIPESAAFRSREECVSYYASLFATL